MEGFKMTLAAKLTTGFAIPIVAIVIIATVVYGSLAALIDSNKWVSHTHEVIGEGNKIMASMVDMETGMRGFLIAGKEEFLEPYIGGKRAFTETISKLKQTVNDNPGQVSRLNDIERLKEDWLDQAAEPQIAKRREVAEGEKASREFKRISARVVGKEMFDGFRAAVTSMQSAFQSANDEQGELLVNELLLAMVNQETGQRGFLLSGQEASLEPYEQGQKDFSATVTKLQDHISSSRLRSTLDDAVRKASGWRIEAAEPEISARRAMNKVSATIEDVTAIIEQGAGKKSMDAIRVKIAEFVSEEENLVVIRTQEAESISDNTMFITIIGTIVSIIVASIVGFIIIRGVRQQIGAEPEIMAEISQRISEGDLTVQVNSTGNETGVYAAMGAMITNLRDIVEQVLGASSVINNAASEVADGNTALSQRTEEQASSLEETASSMEEMTGTVRQNADSAGQAKQLADENRVRATGGSEVLTRTTQAMSDISESSARIADIIGTIDGIAFQTNLLALNAAVEAARAGDHGRGFAVVASEVRTLAQRSADAAKEIKDLIEDSVGKVKAGTTLVDESGKTLEKIIEGTQQVADIIAEIAAASQEQAAGIDQVNNAVTQMDNMTQENAALVEEASASSRSMQEQSHQLTELMGYFKIDSRKLQAGAAQARKLQQASGTQTKPSSPTSTHLVRQQAKPLASKPLASRKDASDWVEF